MNNSSLLLSRLWWKEARQLLPLVALLLSMGLFLHLIFLLSGESTQRVGPWIVFVGIPGLFSVGAGALIIGQEKELGTLAWLSSLPVRRRDLVRVKLLVCLLGLCVVWSVSGLVLLAFESGMGSSPVDGFTGDSLAVLSWLVHTLFVLLSGVAIAWRFRSSLTGLLVLVPVALLPATMASFTTGVMSPESLAWWAESPPTSTLLIFQVIGCVIALGFAWRSGNLALQPLRLGKRKAETSVGDARWQSCQAAPYTPFSALLWQAFRQNTNVYLGCSALAGGAIAIFVLPKYVVGNEPGILAIPMGFASVSWLGVSVFAGDRIQQRIRFLADRGIAPSVTWVTRQALPAVLFLAGCLVMACVIRTLAGSFVEGTTSIWFGLLFGVGLLTYFISQWTGQLFTSPVVAGIAAPVLSFGALVFDNIAYETLGAPLWLLAVCGLIPLMVTYCVNRRWMDGRLDGTYWTIQAVSVTAFLIVPALPFAAAWFTTRGMQPQTRHELRAELSAWSGENSFFIPTELVLTTETPPASPSNVAERGESEFLSLERQAAASAVSSLRDQLNAAAGPIQVNQRVLDFLRFQLQTLRIQLAERMEEASAALSPGPENTDSSGQVLDEQRINLIELTGMLVNRLRVSSRLIDQDTADELEILLVRELDLLPITRSTESAELEAVYRQLGDRAARNRARQRAVAGSWWRFDASLSSRGGGTQLGGYELPASSATNLRGLVLHRRYVERIVETFWKLANANSRETESLRQMLADFWNVSDAFYGLGATGAYYRADSLKTWLPELPSEYRLAPANQWHADWEQRAFEIAQKAAL